jgi:predicted lactoylglutathione lyase
MGGMTERAPVVVSLPIADRRRSSDFYRALLDREPFGAPADDGIPEPLQFALNDGLTLMLVPSGGFGWVIGDHDVAEPGASECVVSLTVADEDAVAAYVDRARAAGGTVVTEPVDKGWGFHGLVADLDAHLWMITVG